MSITSFYPSSNRIAVDHAGARARQVSVADAMIVPASPQHVAGFDQAVVEIEAVFEIVLDVARFGIGDVLV